MGSFKGSIFADTLAFNQDIMMWQTFALNDLTFMSTKSFNQPIFGSWNTLLVTLIREAFHTCELFNHDFSNWNISLVTEMDGMFYGAKTYNHNISRCNISNIWDMSTSFT